MPKVCPVCGANYDDATVFCPADGTTLRAADTEGDLIGSVVADRYLITDLLGEGGMGTVFLARHVRLPQQAAIKVLRKEMVRDSAAVARFNREASNASRIDHERVARVYDFGETSDGTVYLAMEYIAGRTLKEIIVDGGPMPPSRAVGVVQQIAEGLDAAHRLGIVHRDLKPDNVMIVEDPDLGDRVKVVDFGIAKAVGGGDGEPGLTRTGFVVGTPEFMSPEQLLGSDLDARSDVYALALVAYQCLTGALPFGGDTPEATMTARLVSEPKPLRESLSSLAWPAAVQEVFDVALAREPEGRHERAGAFAAALRSSIDAWLTPASAKRAIDAKPVGGAAASGGAAGAATAALGGGSGRPTSAAEAGGAAATGDGASPTGGGSRRGLAIGGIAVVGVAAIAVVVMMLGGGDAPADADAMADGDGPAVPPPTIVAAPGAAGAEPGASESAAETLAPAGPAVTDAADEARTRAGAPADPPAAAPPAAPPTDDRRAARDAAARDAAPPPAAPSTTPAATPATSPPDALATLDSLRRALDPTRADARGARAAIGALRTLMGRLATPTDSAWAHLRLAEAHLLTEDARSACLELEQATAQATLDEQRRVVTRLRGLLGC